MKPEDNTSAEEIDLFTNPATETLLFRYYLVNHWCKGKRVLDASCGKGIGTKFLKILGAKEVVGIDISEESITKAKESNVEGVSFMIADLCDKLDWSLDSFDTVVSIETFEHLPPECIDAYLNNLKHWCKPGGKIIITTPRRANAEWNYEGGTHLKEYSLHEFIEILTKHFSEQNLQFLGIQEVNTGKQLISIVLEDRFYDARVMIAIIKVN